MNRDMRFTGGNFGDDTAEAIPRCSLTLKMLVRCRESHFIWQAKQIRPMRDHRDAMRRDKQTQTVNFGGQATKSTRWMPWH